MTVSGGLGPGNIEKRCLARGTEVPGSQRVRHGGVLWRAREVSPDPGIPTILAPPMSRDTMPHMGSAKGVTLNRRPMDVSRRMPVRRER